MTAGGAPPRWWWAVLIPSEIGLRLADRSPIGTDTLQALADGTSPDASSGDVVMAIVRAVAEAATIYLLVILALHAITRTRAGRPFAGVVRAITIPALRPMFGLTVGLGVTSALAASATTMVGAHPTASVETDDQIESGVASDVTDPSDVSRGSAWMPPMSPPEATMRPVNEGDAGVATMTPTTSGRAVDPAATTWTVVSGESFWTIAEDLAAARHGAASTDQSVHVIWRDLIDRNRDRLVDPDDPDLIHPGQVFDIPPLSGA